MDLSTSSSPAPPARCPPRAAGCPRCSCAAGGDRLLFDCGEGTQRQLVRSVGLTELDDVFLTHFHADHWLGLPGMLKTFDLRGRERPLAVYGPPGLRGCSTCCGPSSGGLRFPLELVELEPDEEVQRDGYRRRRRFAVEHRVTALRLRARRGRPARAASTPSRRERLGVAPGPDFGAPPAGRDGRTASRPSR